MSEGFSKCQKYMEKFEGQTKNNLKKQIKLRQARTLFTK